MCNLYNLATKSHAFAESLQANLQFMFASAVTITVNSIAPGVIINSDGEREVVPMRFSLASKPADLPKNERYPNNNARIESLDKWPWKQVLGNRCILPLDEFVEPCYWGAPAGQQVNFHSVDRSTLYVAGLYSKFGDTYTMTFVMRPANTYVMGNGHHRQPLFVAKQNIDDWIDSTVSDVDATKAALGSINFEPDLAYKKLRDMNAGWEKRAPANIEKWKKQLCEIKKHGPLGIKI